MEACCNKSEKSKNASSWLTAATVFPIRLYRYLISPFLGPSCRFTPTCSEYAEQAIIVHGPLKGLLLFSKRLAKCHPWHAGGYDPVPQTTKFLLKSK